MIPEKLESCFLWDGFNKAKVYREGQIVYYKFAGQEVYVVALYDHALCGIRSVEQLTECARNIKASFYNQSSADRVKLLQIFCVLSGQDVRELCYGYDETWVFEENTHRLIIFENQKGEFLNVRSLIEHMDENEAAESPGAKRFFPAITVILVAVNIIMFILVEATGSSYENVHLLDWGAMYPPAFFDDRQYYRIITEMFLHAGIQHLINNMIVLLIMGKTLEQYVGHLAFLGYYMFSGITAGFASLFYNLYMGRDVISVGASGAIFGITGVMFYLVLSNKGRLEGFTLWQMAMFLGLSVYTGATNPMVDFMAHVAGFIGGFIMAFFADIFSRRRKQHEG